MKGDIARLVELWGDGFKRFGGPFLAGNSFGAVDAFFCPVAFRVQTYGLALPGTRDGVRRAAARPRLA